MRVEGNHWECLNQLAKDDGDILVRVFPQIHIVGVEASEQDLNYFNQMVLECAPVTTDEVPEDLKCILLVVSAVFKRRRMVLD